MKLLKRISGQFIGLVFNQLGYVIGTFFAMANAYNSCAP